MARGIRQRAKDRGASAAGDGQDVGAGAPTVPSATLAYLDTIAFRCENEPDNLTLTMPGKVVHNGRVFRADDLDAGRAFLERWSLPLANLERSDIRALIAELGSGRAAATEGRRWTQMRAILHWWADEDLVAKNLTSRLGVIRGTSIPTLGDDEAIPDEREMWMMAWALCLTVKPQFAALPLVMGAAGLRIGECCELRRRDLQRRSQRRDVALRAGNPRVAGPVVDRLR